LAKTLNEDFLGLAEMADKAASLAGSPFARRYWETVAEEYRTLAAQAGQLPLGGQSPDLAVVRNIKDFNRACRESGLEEDLPADETVDHARVREVLAAASKPRGKKGW
jgi:hypothetical protein